MSVAYCFHRDQTQNSLLLHFLLLLFPAHKNTKKEKIWERLWVEKWGCDYVMCEPQKREMGKMSRSVYKSKKTKLTENREWKETTRKCVFMLTEDPEEGPSKTFPGPCQLAKTSLSWTWKLRHTALTATRHKTPNWWNSGDQCHLNTKTGWSLTSLSVKLKQLLCLPGFHAFNHLPVWFFIFFYPGEMERFSEKLHKE